MKQCLHANVYSSPTLLADRQASIERLTRMFLHLMDNPTLLPPPDEEFPVPQERAVCDYIAGMTDRYALAEHRRLFGSAPELRATW